MASAYLPSRPDSLPRIYALDLCQATNIALFTRFGFVEKNNVADRLPLPDHIPPLPRRSDINGCDSVSFDGIYIHLLARSRPFFWYFVSETSGQGHFIMRAPFRTRVEKTERKRLQFLMSLKTAHHCNDFHNEVCRRVDELLVRIKEKQGRVWEERVVASVAGEKDSGGGSGGEDDDDDSGVEDAIMVRGC